MESLLFLDQQVQKINHTCFSTTRKRSGELNIVIDPIEYDLGNIQQFPVIRAKGQTFAQLLRTFLRQDPDVI